MAEKPNGVTTSLNADPRREVSPGTHGGSVPPPDRSEGTQAADGAPTEVRADSQRDLIIELVIASGAEFWQDPAGDTYLTIVEHGCSRGMRIHSDGARKLTRRLFIDHGRRSEGRVMAPNGQ